MGLGTGLKQVDSVLLSLIVFAPWLSVLGALLLSNCTPKLAKGWVEEYKG